MFGVLAAERIDEHKRGVVAALTTCHINSTLKVILPRWVDGVMSTPFLNAEKLLLPTVLQYCRRTPQHLNPFRGIFVLPPRMYCSTFTGLNLVLFCFSYSFSVSIV